MVVQDTKFAWADDDLPTRRDERERERAESRGSHVPKTPVPTAETLRELAAPVAAAKIPQQPPAEAFVPESPAFVETPVETVAEPQATSTPTSEPKWWSAAQASESRKASAARQAAAAAAKAAASRSSLFTDEPAFPADSVFSPTSTFGASPAAAGTAPSFGSLFDTTTPVAGSAEPVGDEFNTLFGGTTGTRREARNRTPLVSPDLLDQSNGSTTKIVATTGPAWIIAMVPLFQLVLGLLAVTSLGMNGNQGIMIAILVVPYLVVVALAYLDYQALLKGGNTKPAHWAFAFLTAPVYLLLRARATLRQSGHGIGPVLVWIALGILQVVSVIAIPGLLISAAPGVFASQIEQSVKSQAALIAGSDMDVSCPTTPPVLSGEEIVCDTRTAGGIASEATVTLVRSNGWIGWQVIDWGKYGGVAS
jgi:hypothetical protein